MIGAKVFELTAEDILKGMSSSDHITDGGFSNLSEGLNLTKSPGLIYFSAEKVDQTDDLTDDLIASCEDGTLGTSAVDRILVDDAGNYYTWNGTLLDLVATDATTPAGYIKGRTDMISYGISSARANIFTTNTRYITRLQLSSNTLTDNFKEFTFNGTAADLIAPHPALVFENNAYYGDGNLLRRQTSVAGSPDVVLTLPTEQIITALGIDPGTGRMLISTVDGINLSNTKNRICRVLYYDGFSPKVLKSVIVDEQVTAFFPIGATMYIGYGQKLGIWNGAGIQFLRALNVDLNSTQLPYKHNFTNIDDTMYVVEQNKILAFGEVIGGSPAIFYYAFVNKDGNFVARNLSMVCNLGSGLLGFGWADDSNVEKFSTLDTTSIATLTQNNVKFYSNKYSLEKAITFNTVVIEYGTTLPTSNPYADISVITINSNSTGTYGISTTTLIASGATNTVSGVLEMSYPFPTITTRSLQLLFLATQQTPIKRVSFFLNSYD